MTDGSVRIGVSGYHTAFGPMVAFSIGDQLAMVSHEQAREFAASMIRVADEVEAEAVKIALAAKAEMERSGARAQ